MRFDVRFLLTRFEAREHLGLMGVVIVMIVLTILKMFIQLPTSSNTRLQKQLMIQRPAARLGHCAGSPEVATFFWQSGRDNIS